MSIFLFLFCLLTAQQNDIPSDGQSTHSLGDCWYSIYSVFSISPLKIIHWWKIWWACRPRNAWATEWPAHF